MSRLSLVTALFLVCIAVIAAGCTSQAPQAPATPLPATSAASGFNALPKADLNATETADILLLQEEQKFAYDLNAALFGLHTDIPLLLNISDSAKASMKADDVILVRYNIPDPANPKAGVFTNPSLQQMYTNDLNTGLSSAADALKTSAQFADMNTADLSTAIGRTDNQDVAYIYKQQLALARNDLRQLSSALTGYGVVYTPQYITPASYAQIIGSPMETIPV